MNNSSSSNSTADLRRLVVDVNENGSNSVFKSKAYLVYSSSRWSTVVESEMEFSFPRARRGLMKSLSFEAPEQTLLTVETVDSSITPRGAKADQEITGIDCSFQNTTKSIGH